MSLTETGVRILLVYGAKLFSAGDGRPGMRVLVDEDGMCLITPVGYACPTARRLALDQARQTCEDAGLRIHIATPTLIVSKA
jgi:hypothetical protein